MEYKESTTLETSLTRNSPPSPNAQASKVLPLDPNNPDNLPWDTKAVNGLRAFNAVIVKSAAIWSIAFALTPLVLTFLGLTAFFPLWTICLISGLIALGLGIGTGRERYAYLQDTSISHLFYDVKLLGINSTSTNNQHLEENSTPANNSDESIMALSFKQKCLLAWEKIHTFLVDGYAAFMLGSVIIFVVSTVFSVSILAQAILIAGLIAIIYGILSSAVKHSQSNKIQNITWKLKTNFETARGKTTELKKCTKEALEQTNEALQAIKELNEKIKTTISQDRPPNQKYLNKLIESVWQIAKPFGFEPSAQDITSMHADIPDLIQKMTDLQATRTSYRLTAGSRHGRLLEETLKIDLTQSDIYRVIFALFYGELKAGTFVYIALPIILHLCAAPALSTAAFCGIIAGTAFIYGLIHAFYKMKSIEQANWLSIDNDKVNKIYDETVGELKTHFVNDRHDSHDYNFWSQATIDASKSYNSLAQAAEKSFNDLSDYISECLQPNTSKQGK